MKTKLIILSILVFVAVNADFSKNSSENNNLNNKEKVKIMIECLRENGISSEEVSKINSKTDERVRSFCYCNLAKNKQLNDDGSFNEVKAREDLLPTVPMLIAKKIISKCNAFASNVEDICQKEVNFNACCQQVKIQLRSMGILQDEEDDFREICFKEASLVLGGDLDDNAEKYNDCLYKKMGLLNADGTVNEENIRKELLLDLSKMDAEKILAKCRHINAYDSSIKRQWDFDVCIAREKKLFDNNEKLDL